MRESDHGQIEGQESFWRKTANYGKEHWRKFAYPAGVVGAIAYATFWGQDTIGFTIDRVHGSETVSGLVANRGVQSPTDVKASPIKCEMDDYCPVDNTSFVQDRRYFVVLDKCEDTRIDSSTKVQTCERTTYQTTFEAYRKAIYGTKATLPSDSRIVAQESITK